MKKDKCRLRAIKVSDKDWNKWGKFAKRHGFKTPAGRGNISKLIKTNINRIVGEGEGEE